MLYQLSEKVSVRWGGHAEARPYVRMPSEKSD